jgi:hypothetical protein
MMASDVRIINASVEIDEEHDDLVIRGTIDQATLKYIKLDWYQREQGFSDRHINNIVAGYVLGNKVADITIGMRGKRYTELKDGSGYVLHDRCYCMDGGQRLYAAGMAVQERKDLRITLGAKIFLNTTEEFENEMFCRLGTTQVRIAASVLLRNRKKKSAAANTLVQMNNVEAFALKSRIAWDQVATRGDLISGFGLARITGSLHAHKGGALRSTKLTDLADALDVLVAIIGTENLRTNLIRFFDVIDKVWNVRGLSGGRDEQRPHMNIDFLCLLARLFSAYSEFWDGKERHEFYCADKYAKKLKGFQVGAYLRTPTKLPKDALYELLRKRLALQPIFEAADAADAGAAE